MKGEEGEKEMQMDKVSHSKRRPLEKQFSCNIRSLAVSVRGGAKKKISIALNFIPAREEEATRACEGGRREKKAAREAKEISIRQELRINFLTFPLAFVLIQRL